jgi:hypothetical protein
MTPSARPLSPTYTTTWLGVACVFGMDYLSTLAYLPAVAYARAGLLAPVVLAVVVAVTLFLALPLYAFIAGRSPTGTGTLGLIERVIPGWIGKFCVVVLLGFLATDLVFTRTFSAADAAEHVIRSPFLPWQRTLDDLSERAGQVEGGLPEQIAALTAKSNKRQLVVAVGLLVAGTAFGWFFRRGVDRRLVRIAVGTLAIYLAMTALVVGSGAWYLGQHPQLVHDWWAAVRAGAWRPEPPAEGVSLFTIVAAAVVLFPHLALGLSGYELTLAATPLVKGVPGDELFKPVGRIRRTRWMLASLAGLMAIFTLASGLVVTLLVPADALAPDGKAANRALAYLAHGGDLVHGIAPAAVSPIFGTAFGAVYDFVTVTVLTIAGVIVLIGTRNLIPPFLYRLGMEWTWSNRLGLMMYVFTAIKLVVTAFYRADVEAQKAAYLTGVLALFTGAALVAAADVYRGRRGRAWPLRIPIWFSLTAIVFAASLVVVVVKQPVALRMAGAFVVLLLLSSMVTRFFRTKELRFEGFDFADEESRLQWWHLQNNEYPMLLPIRPGQDCMIAKEKDIRACHRIPDHLKVVFIEAELADPSDFRHRPIVKIESDEHRVIVRIGKCTSIPHAIAAAALEIAKAGPVPEVHFGWSHENPLTANINFVLFGQGNVPWMVYELIRRTPVEAERRPRVIVG